MCQAAPTPSGVSDRPVLEQLVELGWEINNNHYRAVHLAARYDNSLQWFNEGLKSAALGIARELDIQSRTAREWIRVGQTLAYLPLIDHAKDQRHYDYRSFTTYLDDDGMTVLRIVLPPAIAKPVIAAVDELVKQIAATPETPTNHPTPSDDPTTTSDQNGPAGPHRPPEHNTPKSKKRSLPPTRRNVHPASAPRRATKPHRRHQQTTPPHHPTKTGRISQTPPPMHRLRHHHPHRIRPQPHLPTNRPHHHHPTRTPMRTLPQSTTPSGR